MNGAPTYYDQLRRWLPYCLLLLIAGHVISNLTPAFQAPDEFDHVRRAYMFGRGQLVLHSVNGSPSGGGVDSGLLRYMNQFVPLAAHPDRKMTIDTADAAAAARWSGKREFAEPVGTAYYFPALYMPQAVGLTAGRVMGWTVESSYHLARFSSLLASVCVLLLAFLLYPPPPLTMVVLALPMSVFLMGSAALDGVATAVTVLGLSAFMRIISERVAAPKWTFGILVICILLVTSCRPNLLPLLLLPIVVGWLTRDGRRVAIGVAAVALVLAWTVYTIRTTVYPEGPRRVDHASRLISFLTHPNDFFRLVGSTLTADMVDFYRASFIGILGWLDTPLGGNVYSAFGTLLIIALVLSISFSSWRSHAWPRAVLLICAVGIVLLTFLALLVQYTDASATTITGIQGRYFTIPIILVGYALGRDSAGTGKPFVYAAYFVASATVFLTLHATTHSLVKRFHSRPADVAQEQALPGTVMVPSNVLSEENPVEIRFPADQLSHPVGLARISLLFGSNGQPGAGGAILHLTTADGIELTLHFEPGAVADKRYYSFLLDSRAYTSGTITSDGGTGVYIWESVVGNAPGAACMVLVATDATSKATPGCDKP